MPKILGTPVGKYYVLISPTHVMDKRSGAVRPVREVLNLGDNDAPRRPAAQALEDVIVKKEVEVVVGVEGKKIDLALASSEGKMDATSGFLIEVYLSGSDGKLTRVYKEHLVDVLNDETLSDGFSSYLKLEIDK